MHFDSEPVILSENISETFNRVVFRNQDYPANFESELSSNREIYHSFILNPPHLQPNVCVFLFFFLFLFFFFFFFFLSQVLLGGEKVKLNDEF